MRFSVYLHSKCFLLHRNEVLNWHLNKKQKLNNLKGREWFRLCSYSWDGQHIRTVNWKWQFISDTQINQNSFKIANSSDTISWRSFDWFLLFLLLSKNRGWEQKIYKKHDIWNDKNEKGRSKNRSITYNKKYAFRLQGK